MMVKDLYPKSLSFELSEGQKKEHKQHAFWIADSALRPRMNDKYFVLIFDRDSLHMDICEHSGTDKHGDTQDHWEKLDGRKYTEDAYVKYWLNSYL